MTLTRFVGRGKELCELQDLVTRVRIVTISGPGGIGKSRLAREYAAIAKADFPDGIVLLELAAIEDPRLLPGAIAGAVKAAAYRGLGELERAACTLEGGRRLLLLDNCEHLREAVADASEYLVVRCPALAIVATSREAVGVRGEMVWQITPMAVPESGATSAEAIAKTDSVQLFCDRARSAAPSFHLSDDNAIEVSNICRRVDGLPLALELAAASVSILSPEQIAARLDDTLGLLTLDSHHTQPRHQTMRAVIEWSNELLSLTLRADFARLTVFVDGFTLEAGETVLCRARLGCSVLDAIVALVQHSLVTLDPRQHATRYRILEPLRQYGAEQLRTAPEEEDDARRRQLQFLVNLAEAGGECVLFGPDVIWLQRLDAEMQNIRTALSWGFDAYPEGASRLAVALMWFCQLRGLYDEGVRWASRAMAHAPLQGRAAHMLGMLLGKLHRQTAAAHYLEIARQSLAEKEDWPDVVTVLFDQSVLAANRGDLPEQRARATEALDLARRVGDEARIMQALIGVAELPYLNGDFETADTLYREALGIAVRRRAEWLSNQARNNLAVIAVQRGEPEAALRELRECLERVSNFGGGPSTTARLIENVGFAAIQLGDAARGLSLVAAARTTFDRLGLRETPDDCSLRTRWTQTAGRRLGPAQAGAIWSNGLGMTLDTAKSEALAVAAGLPVTAAGMSPLTRREAEVARLVAQGLTNARIASVLHLSERTVENHVHNALNRLDFDSRTLLAAWVVRREH